MNNGCVCCTVRGDLVRILRKLAARPRRLDAVLIETTGLADPAPVAQARPQPHTTALQRVPSRPRCARRLHARAHAHTARRPGNRCADVGVGGAGAS